MYEFEFDSFSKNDLMLLNKHKNPDGYGVIYLTTDKRKYIIDVEYEVKELYDRNGIRLEVYEMKDDYTHGNWIDTIRTINTATDYKRFVIRAKKEIIKVVKEFEE